MTPSKQAKAAIEANTLLSEHEWTKDDDGTLRCLGCIEDAEVARRAA